MSRIKMDPHVSLMQSPQGCSYHRDVAGQRVDRAEIVDQHMMLPQGKWIRFLRRKESLRTCPTHQHTQHEMRRTVDKKVNQTFLPV
jgi:hypothetical protein